ncbi:helicase-exonuclease AddAB subunit AddA [[Clostridium] polysaccharolyticum]|uniref:ATP-dependent helicase/nuclease subunit A n=1 Tax=[Clostridium] polysaccharolyticum TaxID=29364 RepID=A0A1H9ZHB0_9FIRM|nr:helicase-exonuclease AddAB subunit AddA [[Clostridium] polysaccharolyticum]SES80705.1 DNA helicase/exodeoxyribonuclease V, subunit A [[Clostridium] polysaccharolyticum]
MASVKWTTEQQKVIDSRDRNILVSAAAGSGKTAVLVERIIQMVMDEKRPIDIDHLLIVTFTKAAASEMRERIEKALEKKLMENPDNLHLQKQMTLVHSAQITTIHSFCKSIIKNYFSVIELDPSVRLVDEVELQLLKADVVAELLEEEYAKEEEAFLHFIEAYSTGKTDEGIEKFILQLYNFSISYPWPKEWLEKQKESLLISSVEDMEQTDWMHFLTEYICSMFESLPEKIEYAMELCGEANGPAAYYSALESDYQILKNLVTKKTYQELYEALSSLEWEKLKRISKKDEVDPELKEEVKALRKEVKDAVEDVRKKYFYQDVQSMYEDLVNTKEDMCVLLNLAMDFYDRFQTEKLEKKVMDFNDLEHYALNILIADHDGDKVTYSEVANELSQYYEEIMIDEYQDSNNVQELLLASVSKIRFGKPNVFMVGDVKQSIYKFRLARPELFMEKLKSYKPWKEGDSEYQRIDLRKNFRSRGVVLDFTNFIFGQIMQDKLGKVEYDEEAALYLGAGYPENDANYAKSVEIIFVTDEEEIEAEQLEETAEESQRELEARAVAEKIKALMADGFQVFDGELQEYRSVRYSDIVILLRTVSGWSEDFVTILTGEGIPAVSDTQSGYFSAIEVKTVLNMLHIIDNPKQDIPLASVLHSPMFGLTSEEMGKIRAKDKADDFYDAVVFYGENGEDEVLKEKLKIFLEKLWQYRKMLPYTPIHQMIEMVMQDTGYYEYVSVMPAGEQRMANLDMLLQKAQDFEGTSYKGLFQFNRYIERLHKYNIDFGEAFLSEDGMDAVRIMSIHKSKGLEFPVVFVSGMGKPFNLQDARSKLIVHEDLGLGADFIDVDIRLKKPTLRKRAIQKRIALESLGEELRVLYVALTRAKEKLILTGFVKKLEDTMAKWEKSRDRQSEKMSYLELSQANSYFSWVGSCLFYPNTLPIEITKKSWHPFIVSEVEKSVGHQFDREALLQWDTQEVHSGEIRDQIKYQLSFPYPFSREQEIPAKFSVTELKLRYGQEEEAKNLVSPVQEEKNKEGTEGSAAVIPKFMKEETEETPAARGILYHKVMQEICFAKINEKEDVGEELDRLVEEQKITRDQKESLDIRKIQAFFHTDLAKQMKQAECENRLFREKQFVMGVPANTIPIGSTSEELVLIQGIIDAYYETADGVVLIDYKTDYIPYGKEEEFVKKYASQVEYYALALNKVLNKEVTEKYLYSFAMKKVLKIE